MNTGARDGSVGRAKVQILVWSVIISPILLQVYFRESRMFASSSQRKHWMFNNEGEIQSLRQEANERYVEEHGAKMTVSLLLKGHGHDLKRKENLTIRFVNQHIVCCFANT